MKTIPPLDLQAEFRQIGSALTKRTRRVLAGGRYILGREVKQFEERFAKLVGTRYALGVASGSDALLLSLMAFDVKAGDEILTTPFSFIATATAIVRLGAKPVFVDIDPATFNLNPKLIRRKITSRTRGMIAVHLYGNPCEIDTLCAQARRFGLFVIEDCAQACGARFKNKSVGSFGDIGAFSFYPTKTLGASGDAGAMTTNERRIYKKIQSLHRHGEESHDHSYRHRSIGINSRLDEIQAAILNVKLKHLARWNVARRSAADRYTRLLSIRKKGKKGTGSTSCLSPFLILPTQTTGGKSVYHQYVIRTPKRDALLRYLHSNGIQAAVYYPIALHLQPCFRNLGYKRGDFPVAEQASREVLSLPLYPTILPREQRKVVSLLNQFMIRG